MSPGYARPEARNTPPSSCSPSARSLGDFSFALDDRTAPIVARICHKVDGIPLAIELAAARVKILSLAALATKIDSHLGILAGGDRLARPRHQTTRHQTMHALIDWSYHLLSPAEQRLFECMSVFAGSCALEQAASVHGDETDGEFAILPNISTSNARSVRGAISPARWRISPRIAGL